MLLITGFEERICFSTAPAVMARIKQSAENEKGDIIKLVEVFRSEYPHFKLSAIFVDVAKGTGKPWTTIRDIYYEKKKGKK